MNENEYGNTTEDLHKALRHYGSAEDFPLVEFATLTELVNAYHAQPGENHWFDKETLQAHGSVTIRMVAPGIIMEGQRPAYRVEGTPEKVWKITGWVRIKSGRITAITVQAFYDPAIAEAFGKNLGQVWADHSNPNYPAPK
jgi:hypothetical protein